MDNFLQLVPMEADADDSDAALVYGEEEDLAVHGADDHDAHDALGDATVSATAAVDDADSTVQFFSPLSQFVAASMGTTIPTSGSSADAHSPPPLVMATPEQQRARFLELLSALESDTLDARSRLDKRLDAVRRIRAASGGIAEQVHEFLPLLEEQRREHDAETAAEAQDRSRYAQVAAELLECARQMSDPRDAEVALVAAFMCASDAPRSSWSRRSPSAIAPAVAALLEDSGALLLDQHHDPFASTQ